MEKETAAAAAVGDEEQALIAIADLVNMHDGELEVAVKLAGLLGWEHHGLEVYNNDNGRVYHFANVGDLYTLTMIQEIHPDDGTDAGYRGTPEGPVIVCTLADVAE